MGDFPDDPVVKTTTAGGTGSIPGWGTKIPHATWQGKKKKKNKNHIHNGHPAPPWMPELQPLHLDFQMIPLLSGQSRYTIHV